ncbi:hypothetical protein KC19_9G127800 [Ceratodon purpureus]|uniref:Protein kinase domain-containing protein n=1 Tax=Ceratodon purpureus TaxID=3225 RepID=A0A8T0GTI1_CERPU|nr:hypothetical protein KC19_9G127800 [Ceratodon purpureus]
MGSACSCFPAPSSRAAPSPKSAPSLNTAGPSSTDAASSSEYYSPRIAKMIIERRNNPDMDKVESEIEASKATWSELSPSVVVGDELAADNLEVFRSLQHQWPRGLFKGWTEREWELGEKIAEGGQAELFELWRIDPAGRRLEEVPWVIKLFKDGLCLRDLQRMWPRGMLTYEKTLWNGYFNLPHCNAIEGAMLYNGRFAFMMERRWGDLRKLIDARMIHNNMQGPPFSEYITWWWCMRSIAEGMRFLCERNITHGDLKAANVLVKDSSEDEYEGTFDPLLPSRFGCKVADYECSVGVIGTGFWRAPEILLAVKNHNITSELFTEASDVYSYGMTCYEIITGRIPFEVEGFQANDYDRVIDGYRPSLPSKCRDWVKELVSRCWHKDPTERPTFFEILEVLAWHRQEHW